MIDMIVFHNRFQPLLAGSLSAKAIEHVQRLGTPLYIYRFQTCA